MVLLISAGVWLSASAALVPLLARDYAAGGVKPLTGVVIWLWHALNYTLLALFALEDVWALGLGDPLRVLGVFLIALGLIVIAAGFYEFRSVQRLTGTRQDELVDSGIYRFSRHPQYLGIILTLIGTGLAGGSGAALLFALCLSVGLLAYLPLEERYVARAFGAQYESYRSRVPMLIGPPG